MRRLWSGLACAAVAVSCARTLPDQDRRIVSAAAEAKLSADLLWKEFQAGVPAATRRYHGRVLLVTGVVTSVTSPPNAPSVLFAESADRGVLAALLDDQAGAITKTATAGQRMTLKCFCEGFDVNVILKSCVKP